MTEEAGHSLGEHTADITVHAWARDLPRLFEEMAKGLFSVICDLKTVHPELEHTIRLSAAPEDDLLHAWLEELNTLHQLHGEVYAEFSVDLSSEGLSATVRGEPIDRERHDLRTEVKAVTWHDFALRREGEQVTAEVLLDI